MQVLVTGATGGLGRNAVEYLLNRSIKVIATGRNKTIGAELAAMGAQFIALDLATAELSELILLLSNVDTVWHCAALSSPWGSPAMFEQNNVTATGNLLSAAGMAGIRSFVHISTPAIYFDYTHRYNVDESFRAKRPASEYARSKGRAEELVQQASRVYKHMQCVVLRPRAIFGPYDQVLVPRLISMMHKNNWRLPLPRGGKVLIDMTYVGNVVEAMWVASLHPNIASGSTYNITNDHPVTIRETLQQLFVEELGYSMNIINVPYAMVASVAKCTNLMARITDREPVMTPYSAGVMSFDMTLSLNRAKKELGYLPSVSVANGIKLTAAWLKQYG
jgi:nucleoside-diphosphate-sugar epimerase